jgi:RNA polymerase sigma factor (sigma-70 family)
MARQDRVGACAPAPGGGVGFEPEDDRGDEARGPAGAEEWPELEPACDPPAPPDYLGRHLFAGANPDGKAPEDEYLALLDSARAPLQALFKKQGIRVEDSEDLLQQALLIVVRCWKDLRDPLGYLLGTARNLGKMHNRRLEGERRLRLALSRMEPAGAGEVPQWGIERQLDVRRLLRRLPESWRRIVEMRYVEELSAGDIALVLGCTAAGVRQSASRAMRHLRRLVAAELAER